jgi:hypothetical protein
VLIIFLRVIERRWALDWSLQRKPAAEDRQSKMESEI